MKRAWVLAATLLLAAVPARADRQSAQFFSARGDKALQAKDFAGAEENFRRALDEDSTFRPARFRLAQALLGLGRPESAMDELRTFVTEMKAEAAPPLEWKALLAKAEKQFADMDAASAEIQKVVDRYASELVALAKKWADKDPGTAERASRRALLLRPSDAKASEVLARVDAAPKGLPVQLFNGTDLKNWEGVEFPFFQVDGGLIVGSIKSGSRQIRSQVSFTGDYDLKMEAMLMEETPGEDAMLALLGCYQGDYDFVGIGLIHQKVYFFDRTGQKEKRILVKTPVAEWKPEFDPAQWTTYELQFRAEEITALINGDVVGKDTRTEHRLTGFVGVYAQAARVGFRKVQVQQR